MRAIWSAIKQLFCVAAVVACAAAAFCITRLPVFGQGNAYELYYTANSSAQSEVNSRPLFVKLTHLTAGESARYGGDRYEELAARYRAKLVFCESVAGIENYYCYSPLLGDPVDLGGRLVNLHIAVSAEQTVAGTPLIFGGF